ncbi:DUF3710 domain-containing protein [Nesterenkonia sp. E16_7]|uniref:DUF3710 domain-containing protein n=1 Tax=unclassified Nesterenkonia TaxID=2629769 RepID=UPI001A931478|nr:MULTISPECIES: DUF3710 domain-containing protein [unclassified Nesterenkonia]MBO0596034.1 DUF3710 domain-containing protein [Nesterenkonia sp. E16_10]MBO0599366.1 DUF3710 domain-containing protein [Nesterenkonia sp. E16_7]
MLFGKKKTPATQAHETDAAPARTSPAQTSPAEAPAAEPAQTEPAADAAATDAAADAAPADPVPADPATAAASVPASSAPVTSVAQPVTEATPLAVPRDSRELESKKGYLDFGALLIPAAKNQQVRLDIDQKTKRVVALTIMVDQASIQVQPFSAPKSGGTWGEVLDQIEESVIKQSGKVKRVDGRFGKELAARVPTVLQDGRKGWRVARFIGFEGPRWFLRGVVGGRGAIDASAARAVEDLFAKIVVVRGDDPLPPRELLRLQPPEGAKRVVVPRNRAQRRDDSPGPNPAAAPVSDVR